MPLDQHSLLYSGDNPTSYALLKGWDVNINTWTNEQRAEFVKWSNAQPEEAGFGAYNRPRPKAVNEGEAFGPGPDEMYQGSYDGAGDTIVWPSRNYDKQQVEDIVAQHDANVASDPNYYSNKIKAANYEQYDHYDSSYATSEDVKYPWARYDSSIDETVPESPFQQQGPDSEFQGTNASSEYQGRAASQQGPDSEFQGTNASSEYQGRAASDYRDINSITEGSRAASNPSSVFDRPNEAGAQGDYEQKYDDGVSYGDAGDAGEYQIPKFDGFKAPEPRGGCAISKSIHGGVSFCR